jgi:ankyrin repeat protein
MNNDKLELVDTLLSRGASGEGINSALVKALTYVVDGQASQDLIELLLQYHADVDFDHGKSLQLAGYHGNQDLFEMLLKWNPNPHSLYMGLKAAMSNDIDEETVFRLFKSVTAHQTLRTKPDVNNLNDSGYPLIFYCLYNYPASVRLAKEICDLGADMSATILFEKNESEYDDFASDRITPLSVSLEKNCSDEVIDVLLAYGGK